MNTGSKRPKTAEEIRDRSVVPEDLGLVGEYLVVTGEIAKDLKYDVTDVEGNSVGLVFVPVPAPEDCPGTADPCEEGYLPIRGNIAREVDGD